MAKEGDLWDDSALVNAFDQAMSKYKEMHVKGYKENSNEPVEVKSFNEDASTIVGENQEPKSLEMDGTNSHGFQTASEMGQASHSATAEENKSGDPKFVQDYAGGSQYVPVQDPSQSYSDCQGVEDYNQLYKQYYEIEEQRQTILQKLQQFGGWDYSWPGEGAGSSMQWGEGAGSSMQWGTTSAPQEQQFFTNQTSQAANVFSGPCISQCTPTSCRALPVCSLPGSCTLTGCTDSPAGVGKHATSDDDEIVKTVMGAANKAISMMKEHIAGKNKKQRNCPEADQSNSSDTDFAVVLNAWYFAGFYTGKYLTEQSLAKK